MYLGLHLNPLSETRDNLNFITDVKFSHLSRKVVPNKKQTNKKPPQTETRKFFS